MATQAMPQGGLFGPSLDEYTQAQTQRDDQAAVNFAGMDDNQRNSYLMYKAGGMLMKPIMGALGYENTAESRIKKVQDISSKYDTTTADGLMQTAKAFNDAGMSREAQIALNKAREMQAAASKLTYEDAKTQRELAVAERALREPKSNEFPNLPPEVQAMMMLEKLPPESGAAKNIRAWLDGKAKTKGEWSDPYQLNGATVVRNMVTGEPKVLIQPDRTRGRGGDGAGAGGVTPPKNLTREARLKWELDNGLIDQDVYDTAMAGTAGGKVKAVSEADQKKTAGFLKAAGYDPATGNDQIETLIKNSTSGGLEQAGASIAGFFGASTKGAQAINTLAAASNRIVMEMMGGKLGAGVSNADRDFIVGQLGDIANPNKPIETRLAAWQFAKARMIEVGLLPQIEKSPADTKAQDQKSQLPTGKSPLTPAEQAELAALKARFNK
jgi:hypothetical protein